VSSAHSARPWLRLLRWEDFPLTKPPPFTIAFIIVMNSLLKTP
jgi:hypothetical protein